MGLTAEQFFALSVEEQAEFFNKLGKLYFPEPALKNYYPKLVQVIRKLDEDGKKLVFEMENTY